METRYPIRISLFSISLSLGLIVGCGDGGNSSLEKLTGVEGQSYCDAVNRMFHLALSNHLTKSEADAPVVYTAALRTLINARPLPTSVKADLESELFPDGAANPKNLESCDDLMTIQKAWNNNPVYSSENPDLANQGISSAIAGRNSRAAESSSNVGIFLYFMSAFATNLDNYSRFQPGTDVSDEKAYDFGVRLDLSAELEYDVKKINSARVAGVVDTTQDLKAGDQIKAVEWNVMNGTPRKMSVSDISPYELTQFFAQNRSDKCKVYVERKAADGKVTEVQIELKGLAKTTADGNAPIVVSEIQGNLIYVKLFEFSESGAAQMSSQISRLKESWLKQQVASGRTNANPDKEVGIILDLRFNPGGDVGEALRIASLFVPYQQIGAIRSNKGDEPAYPIPLGVTFENPMAVLVNHASASASEILSQILIESGRAVFIGEKTYGKLIGQRGYMIGVAGNMIGILWVTAIRFFGPSGENKQLAGIIPQVTDVSVPQYTTWKQDLKSRCDAKQVDNWRRCILEMSDWKKIPGKDKGLIDPVKALPPQGKSVQNPIALKLTDLRKPAAASAPAVMGPPAPVVAVIDRDEVTREASKILATYIQTAP